MPRTRLGEGREPGDAYVGGDGADGRGMHAVRVGGRPYLVLVEGTPSGGRFPLSALTVAPNGSPDLVEGWTSGTCGAAALVADVRKAAAAGSADVADVNYVVRSLTKREGSGAGASFGRVRDLLAAAGFPDAFVDAMSALRAIPSGNREMRRAIFQGTDAFRHACIAFPLLAEARWQAAAGAADAGGDPLQALCVGNDDESAYVGQALLRRLRGLDSDDFFPGLSTKPMEWAIELLAAVPPDWVPGDAEGRLAFAEASVAVVHAESVSGLTTEELVAGSKGNWPAFVRRCKAAAGDDVGLYQACTDLKDLPVFLRDRLVIPLLARAGDADVVKAQHVAREWVYAGKTLPGALEASASWHANLDGYVAALPDRVGQDEAWGTPFEEAEVGGLAFVPLVTGRELREEGARGPDRNGVSGLRHCVGSYKADARTGACHIVSVRRVGPDGYERVATAEFTQEADGPATLVQLRGPRNAEVTPDVAAAVAAYAARERAAWPVLDEAGVDLFERNCGYDWRDDAAFAAALGALQPLLPRRLRGLDEAGLLAEAGLEEVPAPTPW